MGEEKSLKYGLYARKSTESDERQALSIESQKKEMEEIASKENLKIEKEYEEKHSAKESRSRPSFISLIDNLIPPLTIDRKYLRSILFGAEDGLISTTGLITSISVGSDNNQLVLFFSRYFNIYRSSGHGCGRISK